MKASGKHEGRHWEATLNAQRTSCDWILFEAAAGSAVRAKGTITFGDEKYRPHVTQGHMVSAELQELLLTILDEMPELRELS